MAESQPRASGFVRTAARARPGAEDPDPTPAAQAARRLLPHAEDSAALDRVAALAAALLGTPYAQVSLLTDVQHVAAGAGLPAGSVGSSGPLEDSLCTVTAAGSTPLLVSDAPGDVRVSSLPPVTSGQVVAYLGVPLFSDAGDAVGALCVFDRTRRSWESGEVAVLEQLAGFVRAQLEVAALGRELDENRARWDLAAEAGDVGSFDWDLVTDELVWDDRLIAIYGYDDGDTGFDRTVASLESRVHPDDAAMVDAVIAEAIASVGPLHVTYRILLPGGRLRWLEARGRALAGADGTASRLIGVTWDVTDDRANETRADRILGAMTVGYVAVDAGQRVTYVNAEGARLLGAASGDIVGRVLWDLFPQAVDSDFGHTYRRVTSSGQPETIEAYYPAPLDAWYDVRITPEGGGVAVYFLDITERRRTVELLQMSLDASEQMVDAGTVDEAVAALARLVVPSLADWSIVTLLESDGRMRDVESWHVDPQLRSAVARYAAFRLDQGGSGVVRQSIQTAAPVQIRSGVTEFGRHRVPSATAREALEVLAPESAVTMPLLSGSTVVGVLTLCRGAARPPMDARDLAVADSLGRRAGLAVENARLSADQIRAAARDRSVAQALQLALLTTLPQPEHLWLAARYLTAEDRDRVGGDWYDVVEQPDGSTIVVIGDVVGHDISAAATMGQLRTMLRMLALEHPSPAQMLTGLDAAVDRLGLDTLASVVVARIEPEVPGSDERTVRWSNAGHPPPVLVHPDGSTELMADDEVDLVIGVHPDGPRTEHSRGIPTSAALLLYTDGLVERRAEALGDGIDRLQAALRRHHRLEPPELVDRVIEESVEDQPSDDVAVLAVRFGGPDDRGRP